MGTVVSRALPADLAALVAAGHLVEVEPDVYRRAQRRMYSAPTGCATGHAHSPEPRSPNMSLSTAAITDMLALDAVVRQTVMPPAEYVVLVREGDEARLLDRRDGTLLARADVSE